MMNSPYVSLSNPAVMLLVLFSTHLDYFRCVNTLHAESLLMFAACVNKLIHDITLN